MTAKKCVKVQLDTIDKVKRFLEIVKQFNEDVDLLSGRYIIDAKSLMGIFTLDLSKDIYVRIHSNDEDIIELFYEQIKEFESV